MRHASAQNKVTRSNVGSRVLTLFCHIDCMSKEKIEGEREKERESVQVEAGHHPWIQRCLVGLLHPGLGGRVRVLVCSSVNKFCAERVHKVCC